MTEASSSMQMQIQMLNRRPSLLLIHHPPTYVQPGVVASMHRLKGRMEDPMNCTNDCLLEQQYIEKTTKILAATLVPVAHTLPHQMHHTASTT